MEKQDLITQRSDAITFLVKNEGWNFWGADAIVQELSDEDMAALTVEQLVRLSDDYKSR